MARVQSLPDVPVVAGPDVDPALAVVARLLALADAADVVGLEDRARRARRLAGLLLGAGARQRRAVPA